MPVSRCGSIISEAAKGLVTPEEADKLVRELRSRAMRKKASGAAEDLTEIIMREAKDMAEEMTVEAAIQKRNKIINMTRYKALSAQIQAAPKKFDAIKDVLVGQGQSIGARQKMHKLRFWGRMLNELERADLLPVFNDENYGRAIAKEISALNTPDPHGLGHAGVGATGNPKAQAVAQIVYKWQRQAVEMQNDLGAWIRTLPGYIARTSHDSETMRAHGFEKWKTYVAGRLDDATFKHLPFDLNDAKVFSNAQDKFLRSVYESLTSGLHFKHGEGNFDVSGAMAGSSNIAKRMSRERLLHFKSADDWLDYNATYGAKSFREAIMSSLEYASQNIGLMETLGTNPRNMLDRLVQDSLKAQRAAAVDGNKRAQKDLDALEGKKSLGANLDQFMAELDGTTFQPVSMRLAKVAAGVRAVQSMAKLGGSVVSSLPDIVTLASELKHNGVDLLGSYAGTLDALFTGRHGIEKENLGELVLSGLESMIGDIHTRFHAEDGAKGTMSRLMYLNFRFNGQNWWNDVLKSYATSAMSTNLAHHADMKFSKLPEALKKVLTQYDIGEREWMAVGDLIRKSDSGIRRVFPEQAYEIQNSRLREIFGDNDISDAKLRDFKKNLQSKLDTYFTDRSDVALPTPGPAERAFMLRGTQPGTLVGEALRFVGQFKSFPITFLSKVYGRDLAGMKSGNYAIAGMAHTILGTTVMGYLAMATKDILKGKTPRTAADAKTWGAAFVQGGGAGIYGDFLFGEYNRYGRSWSSTILGPTLGQVDDVGELYNRMRKGDDFGANAFRMVKNNTPFVNLFYTRAAMDYLLLYQVQEMMNPGFLSRMEERVREENGQEFFVSPEEHSSLLGFKP